MSQREVGGQPPEPLAADEIHALRARLLDFFDREQRDLPWRATDDPYAIWVSEIMAQQTRVETVVPYYRAWLKAFPTVRTLADADEAEVMKRWEGLGYYSRARNLHRAAVLVRDRFGGRLPDTVEALRALPGVGPYTAGAVASIAFGVATPAVDGNVTRVFARLFDDPSPTAARLAAWGGALVDPDRPGDFNQALMELGATVCTPRAPTCMLCPVATHCRALARGTVGERPEPKRRRPVPQAHHVVLVAARRDAGGAEASGDARTGWRVRLERRPDTGLLAGLWAFPGAEVAAPPDAVAGPGARSGPAAGDTADPAGYGAAALELAEERALLPERACPPRLLAPVPHVFSHLKVTYHPVLVRVAADAAGSRHATGGGPRVAGGGDPPDGTGGAHAPAAWIPPHDPAALTLPVAQQKILRGVVRELAAH